MRPPFPGMDPWLEHPAIWPDVHNRLITAIADDLAPRLAPKYFVGVEQRVYLWCPGSPTSWAGRMSRSSEDRIESAIASRPVGRKPPRWA